MKTRVLLYCLYCANLFAGLALFTANPAGGAPDPFYSSLQEEGRLALEGRDFAAAERTLKVAAFGLLEEPPSLASCLTLLALAQDGGKRPEPFRATVRRIAELEQRFGAYRAGGLDPETRRRFEEAVRRNLTPSALAALPWIERAAAPAAAAGASKKSRRSRPAESETVKVAVAETPRAQDAKATPKVGDVARSAPAVTAQKPPVQATAPAAAPQKTPPTPAVTTQKPPVQATAPAAAPEKTPPTPAVTTQKPPVQATAPRQDPATVSPPAPKPVPPPAPPQVPAAAPARTAASPQASEPPAPALEVAKLKRTMAATTTLSAMKDVLRQAQALASAYPASEGAHRLVAESAYRSSQWTTAAAQYAQIEFDPEREPLLCYYAAVSFFEVGNTSEAAKLLRQCQDLLAPTPAVQSYVERILGGGAASPRP